MKKNNIKKYKQQFELPSELFRKICSFKNGTISTLSHPFMNEYELYELDELYPNILSFEDIELLKQLYDLTPNESVNLISEIILFWELPQNHEELTKIDKSNIPNFTTSEDFYNFKIVLNTGYKQLKHKITYQNWFILLVCNTIETNLFRYENKLFYELILSTIKYDKFIEYCEMYWSFICNDENASIDFVDVLQKTELNIFENMNDYDRDVIAKNVILFRTYCQFRKIEICDTESFIRALKLEIASSM